MGRRIKFTPQALEDLKQISRFHKNAPKRAAEIKKKILKGFDILLSFPFSGTVIEVLYQPDIFRSLVVDKQYKFIYTVEDEVILILSIFDCRQDPTKLYDVLLSK